MNPKKKPILRAITLTVIRRRCGRVMTCLENVFIHDGKGHPLYFQTFQGHADLGKHALKMLTKLTHLFDEPSARVSVKRILVRIVDTI
jgi:hypothetical protein